MRLGRLVVSAMVKCRAARIKLLAAPSESALRSESDNFQYPWLRSTLVFSSLCSPFYMPCL